MGQKLQPLLVTDTIPWRAIRGKRIAIDGSNMLFQLLYNPIQRQRSETLYTDKTGRVITHLYGWLQKIAQFQKHQLCPVVVFDGVPNALKRSYSPYRYQNYITLLHEYQEAQQKNDWHTMKTIGTDPRFFWPTCIQESKLMLESCGIPIILAPEEAEAQCVALQKRGLVDYVVTQDLDVLVYNATHVIRQLTFKTQELRAGKWQAVQPGLTMLDGPKIRTTLNLSPFELIDLSILVGNDYFPGIRQIGPQTAVKALQYYHSLENIRVKHPAFFSQLSPEKIATIRRLFMCPNVTNLTHLPEASENFHRLRALLLQDHSLHDDKVTPILQRIQSLKKNSSPLEDFTEDDRDEDPTLFNPNEFTAALHLPKNKEADKKEQKEHQKGRGKTSQILPKVLNLDELKTKGIAGYMRFEILFDKQALEVYYVKQSDPIELWPYNVQLQFVILVDILHNLCFIPDRVYRTKYEPLLARVEHADQMLAELKDLCDNACVMY